MINCKLIFHQGKCIKRVALAAVKLKLVAANNVLLAVKTGKSRSVVSINKETLTIEKTHKLGNVLLYNSYIELHERYVRASATHILGLYCGTFLT